jgi:hypothetical protein
MIFAVFWLDNPKPNNKMSSTYEIRYRSGFNFPDYELTEHTLPVKSGAQEIRK